MGGEGTPGGGAKQAYKRGNDCLTSGGNPGGLAGVKKRTLLLLTLLTAAAACTAHAQSRADTASRTAAGQMRVQAAEGTTGGLVSEAESDIGERQPVGAAAGGFGAYLIGDAVLSYTSNPYLKNNPGQGDMYFVARGGFGVHPNIAGGLYADAHVTNEVYQYSHFSDLNFYRLSAGGGFDYVFESLGQLTASVRYEYERYLDGGTFSEFYVNNAINVSLAKEFVLNDIHAIQVGWQGSFSVTAIPAVARRNAYDFWVGHRWRIIERLELQTYYVVTIYNYPNDSRTDLTQNVGGTLVYAFTNWARVSANAGFGANNSTNSFFDYTVVNVGGTVGVDIRF